MTASYCDCCNIRTDPNCTASGTVTCLSCVRLLSVIANKPPFVCQITDRMCLFVTSTVATQFTANLTAQVTFLQTKCTTAITVDSFPHSCYQYFGASNFTECDMKFPLALISLHTDIFWHIKRFLVGEFRKIFRSTIRPTRDVSSVQLLQ